MLSSLLSHNCIPPLSPSFLSPSFFCHVSLAVNKFSKNKRHLLLFFLFIQFAEKSVKQENDTNIFAINCLFHTRNTLFAANCSLLHHRDAKELKKSGFFSSRRATLPSRVLFCSPLEIISSFADSVAILPVSYVRLRYEFCETLERARFSSRDPREQLRGQMPSNYILSPCVHVVCAHTRAKGRSHVSFIMVNGKFFVSIFFRDILSRHKSCFEY